MVRLQVRAAVSWWRVAVSVVVAVVASVGSRHPRRQRLRRQRSWRSGAMSGVLDPRLEGTRRQRPAATSASISASPSMAGGKHCSVLSWCRIAVPWPQ